MLRQTFGTGKSTLRGLPDKDQVLFAQLALNCQAQHARQLGVVAQLRVRIQR